MARLGLADVLLDRLPLLVAVYAITRTLRVEADTNHATMVAWLAVCFLAAVWKPGLYVLAGTVFLLAQHAVELPVAVHHNGFMLIGWLALAAALFDGRQRLTAVRTLTILVYAFAAANKLFWPFMSGQVFSESVPWMPHPELVAPLVVFVEAMMAVAVWKRWRFALPAAVLMHAGFVVGIHVNLETTLTLIDFNVMTVLLVGITTRHSQIGMKPHRATAVTGSSPGTNATSRDCREFR